MEDFQSKAYAEVNEILNLLGEEYRRKIPNTILNVFNTMQNTTYSINIQQNTDIQNICISKTALIIISILNYKYWETNEENKRKLKNIYDKNEMQY